MTRPPAPRRNGGLKGMLYDLLIAPFLEFEFMRRALVGTFALSVGAAPIGVFLMLRRMSLIGDAMAHAILPGAAIGFMFAGLESVRHGRRRIDRGLRHRRRRRPDRARHRAEGRCLARRLLPDLARARRHHRLAQRHQRRSPALPVRLGAGGGRSHAAADRFPQQRIDHPAGADLAAAGAGMRRSRLPALGQPRGRARRISLSCCWW